MDVFGFPVQLFRALAAAAAAIFVVRFLRSFEVEKQRQIDELQQARLQESQRREDLRRELFRRVVAAQEAERQRIARELHDETGQALTAISMGLRGASTSLRQDVDRSAHNLRQLEGMAVSALDELRRLIADLRPSHLDDLGLPAALRWYVGELQERTKIAFHIDIPSGPCPLPATITTAVFRVAQEALNNTIKHAHAENAWVTLTRDSGVATLDILDDGIGFDQSRLPEMHKPVWGLLGMRERINLCDGDFLLESKPGRGTRIRVQVPCPDLNGEEETDDNQAASGG